MNKLLLAAFLSIFTLLVFTDIVLAQTTKPSTTPIPCCDVGYTFFQQKQGWDIRTQGWNLQPEECFIVKDGKITDPNNKRRSRCSLRESGVNALGTSCDVQKQICTLDATKEKNSVPPCATSVDKDSLSICPEVQSGIGLIPTKPTELIRFVFGLLLSISGGIALILIIRSGYEIVMSQGNPEKVQGARETITSAIVGLLFIIFSIVILELIGVSILKIPGLK